MVKTRTKFSETGAENAAYAKNVAEMIPHEIQRAVVSYINDQNQARMCIHFQDALVA